MQEQSINLNLLRLFSHSKIFEGDSMDETRERSGEKRLWLAVLHNFFYDVFATESYSMRDQRTIDSALRRLEQLERETKRFHFAFICELAGFEPSYIRRKVEFIIGKIRTNLIEDKGPYFKELADRTKALRKGNRSRQRFGSPNQIKFN